MPIKLSRSNDVYTIHDNGQIERPGRVKPSNRWFVVCAVRYDNFGHMIERFTINDLLHKSLQWKFKNGKQRIFIRDFDHGSQREWRNNHEVVGSYFAI